MLLAACWSLCLSSPRSWQSGCQQIGCCILYTGCIQKLQRAGCGVLFCLSFLLEPACLAQPSAAPSPEGGRGGIFTSAAVVAQLPRRQPLKQAAQPHVRYTNNPAAALATTFQLLLQHLQLQIPARRRDPTPAASSS